MGLLTFLPATRTTTTTTFSSAGAAKHKHHKTRQQQQQQQQPPPPPSKTRKKQDHNNKRDDHRNRHKTPPKQRSKPVIQNPNPKPKLKQQRQQQEQEKQQQQYSSWDQFKNLLTCKQIDQQGVHDPSKIHSSSSSKQGEGGGGNRSSSSCGSMCSFRDVVHGNTRVVDRADSSSHSPESSSLSRHRDQADETRSLVGRRGGGGHGSSSGRSFSGVSVRSAAASAGGNNGRHPSSTAGVRHSRGMGMPLGKFSGCYECRMIVDPSRYPIIPRTTASTCSQCGEIFPKIESLEHHQAVRHAVSELGAEDSGRNIVEIIFKSSWLKKEDPICKIERILKVHNTQRTIQRFEDCRDAVKLRANNNTKKNPRCAADGNELLRFHCTTLSCALGARGSSSLCGSVPGCGVCTIIRHGFQGNNKGVTTTASSGRAHDSLSECADGRKAMLVCRVIAGRVRRINNTIIDPASTAMEEDDEVDGGRGNLFGSAENAAAVAGTSYDSVAGSAGIYSNLEELVVFNPKAILPCFVVIYKTMNIGAS